MKHDSQRPALAATRAAVLCSMLLGACAGPERAPHAPIKGVDTEHRDVDNEHDAGRGAQPESGTEAPTSQPSRKVSSGGGHGSGGGGTLASSAVDLRAFAQQFATGYRQAPGVVAVFPALTRAADRQDYYVTGLGEGLMEETAVALEQAGVAAVVHGAELRNDMRARNRDLDSLRGPDDVFWIADRIGADYAVYGTVRERRLGGKPQLEIDWIGIRQSDRQPLAQLRPTLTGGPEARRLHLLFESESDFKVGAAVPPFQPSLFAEVALLTRDMVHQVVTEAGSLDGKTVVVLPTAVDAPHGHAKALATQIRATLDEQLRTATKDKVRIADEEVDKAILAVIEREAAQSDRTGSIDPDTVAYFERRGSDYLLRSTLRPAMGSYALRVALIDLRTGRQHVAESRLEPQFKAALEDLASNL